MTVVEHRIYQMVFIGIFILFYLSMFFSFWFS